MKSLSFGTYDDANEFQNFSHFTNNIIKQVICKNVKSKIIKIKVQSLNEESEPKDNFKLKVHDFFDTTIIDSINEILNNKPTKGVVKYLTEISLETFNSSSQLMGGANCAASPSACTPPRLELLKPEEKIDKFVKIY